MTLIEFIKQHFPGHLGDQRVLPFETRQESIDSHHVITNYGQVENKILFLSEGVVQVSTMKGEEERILEFVFPNEFFSAYTSFVRQEPADVQVLTLTKCNITIIEREDLLQANRSSLLANQLNLHIAQQLFLSRAQREKDFLTLSAEERYRMLLKKDPEIVKLIPGVKIARYLGIQPESLSRIRKSIIS